MRAHSVWIPALSVIALLAPRADYTVGGEAPSDALPEDQYDKIVDDFIQYDIGRLRGKPGQIANQRFQALKSPRAIPALCRGAIKASRIPASCPIIVISSKLGSLLRSTNDQEMLQHALDHLDPPGPRAAYGTYLNNLRQIANEQLERLGGKPGGQSSSLRGGGTASQLRRSRLELDDWSHDDLAEAVVQEQGTRLLQVLEELRDRKGSVYTEALAHAITVVDDDVKPIARGLLASRLIRMTDRTLKAKIKDSNPDVRAAAALAIGYKGSPLYEDLVAALRDKSALVAKNAHDVLVKMSGEDYGPAEGASGMQWFHASKRWEAWLETRNEEDAPSAPRESGQ